MMKMSALLLASTVLLAAGPPLVTAGKCLNTPSSEERLRSLVVLAKHFLVAMRRNDHDALRKSIHPGYLEKHGLAGQAAFGIEVARVLDIHDLRPTLDGKGMLCLYTSQTGDKECLLLRFKMEGDMPYVLPSHSPGTESREFTPWLLRYNLEKFIEIK